MIDLRRAVRADQALHGERLIRLEFLGATALCAVLSVLVARYVVQLLGSGGAAPILVSLALLVFFIGLAVNYATLLCLSLGRAPDPDALDGPELARVSRQFSVLILLPGACAVVAWRQRRRASGRFRLID